MKVEIPDADEYIENMTGTIIKMQLTSAIKHLLEFETYANKKQLSKAYVQNRQAELRRKVAMWDAFYRVKELGEPAPVDECVQSVAEDLGLNAEASLSRDSVEGAPIRGVVIRPDLLPDFGYSEDQ